MVEQILDLGAGSTRCSGACKERFVSTVPYDPSPWSSWYALRVRERGKVGFRHEKKPCVDRRFWRSTPKTVDRAPVYGEKVGFGIDFACERN